jgi:hypothetical protein
VKQLIIIKPVNPAPPDLLAGENAGLRPAPHADLLISVLNTKRSGFSSGALLYFFHFTINKRSDL